MEAEIIQTALDNLKATTGITGQFTPHTVNDGTLNIDIDGKVNKFIIEVKNAIRRHQLLQLDILKRQHDNYMVVAEHIFPKIKEELRHLGIAYLEANGNLFIKNDHSFILIDTNKKVSIKKETANRAFTKTGLKVLFHLLLDKQLVNKTQREIANITGVGLGNIPQVIQGLKETGYLIQYNKQSYVWENRKELLDRWINAYATELRPKLLTGKFTIMEDWQSIRLDTKKMVWGGEPAADKLTHHLRPEHLIVYTNEKPLDLIKNYSFVPQEDGELEVLELFWNPTDDIAPPLLIYAELILTGGKRNKETAEIIFNDHVQPIL